jgi:hypothetical protein
MFRIALSLALTLAELLPAPAAAAEPPQPGLARSLDQLIRAYPDFLARIEGNALVWHDGMRMAIDDGQGPKPFAKLLEAPDIKDMFYTPYPQGPAQAPGRDIDPGRVRHTPLLDKMYGDCRKGEVEARLVDVVWLPRKWGRTVKATRINGVAARLAAVSQELDALPAAFDAFLAPAAGTYHCRVIAGTTRTSPHGHGIAIDIAPRHADYWRWSRPGRGGALAYRNRIPLEIVEVFERHGFIWGGRWHHFDTMHFEYRPELLPAGQAPQRLPASAFRKRGLRTSSSATTCALRRRRRSGKPASPTLPDRMSAARRRMVPSPSS